MRIERSVLILLFTLTPLAAKAVEGPRPVFIRASCDGKIASVVLSALKDEIRTSVKYRLVRGLDDDGRMDSVLTIYMNCTERSEVTAVATNYGSAHCYSSTDCRGVVDGSSIRSALCDSGTAAECGRSLFKAFDDYTSAAKPPL